MQQMRQHKTCKFILSIFFQPIHTNRQKVTHFLAPIKLHQKLMCCCLLCLFRLSNRLNYCLNVFENLLLEFRNALKVGGGIVTAIRVHNELLYYLPSQFTINFWVFQFKFFNHSQRALHLGKEVKLYKFIEVPENGFQDVGVLGSIGRQIVLKGLIVHKAIIVGGEQLLNIALVEEKEVNAPVYQIAAIWVDFEK